MNDRDKLNAILEIIEDKKFEEFKQMVSDGIGQFKYYCKITSPIEEMLLHGLALGQWEYWRNSFFTSFGSEYQRSVVFGLIDGNASKLDAENGEFCMRKACVLVIPQYSIHKYRTDFAIFVGDKQGYQKIAIECDGHDFHEKNKKQVQRDKERDRFFQSKGWKLLRFSGSEIYNDPIGKADEVIEFVGSVYRYDVMGHVRR
jgi:very-short-patch-repair endonuclease